MQLLPLLQVALFVVTTSAQPPFPAPSPGKIVSPKDGAKYLYKDIITFAYNYTEAAQNLEFPPEVDVFLHKPGDEHFVTVFYELDCDNSSCEDGILKRNFTSGDYHPVIGWGNYELYTIQVNYPQFADEARKGLTTRSVTGKVSFEIILPFGEAVIESGLLSQV